MLQYEQIGVNPKPMQIPPNVIHCKRSQQVRVPMLIHPGARQQQHGTQASCLRSLYCCGTASTPPGAGMPPKTPPGQPGSTCKRHEEPAAPHRGSCFAAHVQPAVLYQSKQSAQPCKSCSKTASKQSPRAKGSQTNTRKHKHNTLAFELY